jgi:hypothetical protein
MKSNTPYVLKNSNPLCGLILAIAFAVFASTAKANDTFTTANPINALSSSGSRTVNAGISPAGDIDFYQIQLNVPGRLIITTASGIDTYGYVYDSLENELGRDDDTGDDLNFRIERQLSQGTYFIRVNHYSTSGTGNYSLRISFVADPIQTDDHGNSPSSATSINIASNSGSRAGKIEEARDEDYFRIIVPTGGDLAIESQGSTDVYGHLYDSSENELTRDDDSGSGYNFSMERTVSPGTYYIRVRHWSSSGTGPYSVNVSFTPEEVPESTEQDSGDAFVQPSIVTIPHADDYYIDEEGDEDYFRFTVSRPGRLEARSTGDTDTYGNLYNANRRQLAYNDDSAGTLNFSIGYDIPAAGTYFLRVRHFSPTGTGPYRLLVDFTPVGVAPTPVDPENPPPAVVAPGSNRRAVVVGISNYQYINDLNLCDDDARAMTRLLRRKGWNVTMLIDEQATKNAIRQAVRSQVRGASDFVFHFSGHGTRYGSEGFLCTYNGTAASSFISEDELADDIGDGGPNVRVGVILDSCHSGEFIARSGASQILVNGRLNRAFRKVRFAQPRDWRERAGARNGAAGVNMARDLQRNSWTVLTACRGSQYAYELGSLSGLDSGLAGNAWRVPPTVNEPQGHGWLSWNTVDRLPRPATDRSRNNFGSIEEVWNLVQGGFEGIQHPQLFDGDTTRQFDVVAKD